MKGNPVAVALAAREAMRRHRAGKPIVLKWPAYPVEKRGGFQPVGRGPAPTEPPPKPSWPLRFVTGPSAMSQFDYPPHVASVVSVTCKRGHTTYGYVNFCPVCGTKFFRCSCGEYICFDKQHAHGVPLD